MVALVSERYGKESLCRAIRVEVEARSSKERKGKEGKHQQADIFDRNKGKSTGCVTLLIATATGAKGLGMSIQRREE
jgi:hypothetical protein